MDLTDYENDPYAPRPKASQAVAAQKRRTTPTDTEPSIAPAKPPAQLIVGIAGVFAVIGVLALALSHAGGVQRPGALAITPGPSTAAFLTAPTAAPAPTSAPTALPRTIPAYAAPDGLLLGQIETTRQIVPVAHYGSGWIQADVAGSGVVWLRAEDVPGVALIGPDLAPVATPAPQTGRGLGTDQGSDAWTPPEATTAQAAAPTATPAPDWPTSAPAAVADFEKPDITGTCQFVGCLGQQAVDLARAQACHALYWQYGDADAETIPEPDLSAVRGCVWEGLYR